MGKVRFSVACFDQIGNEALMSLLRPLKIFVLINAVALSATAFASARGTHATVWSLFESKKSCESFLLPEHKIAHPQAIEPLLYELIGDKQPVGAEPNDKGFFISYWREFGEFTEPQRNELAKRLLRIQGSFSADKTKSYSFSQALRGEQAIDEYLSEFRKFYDEGFAALDVTQEMKAKNKKADRQMIMHLLGKGVFVGATTLGTALLSENALMPHLAFLVSTMLAPSLPTTTIGRLSAHFKGDKSYRRVLGRSYFTPELSHVSEDWRSQDFNAFGSGLFQSLRPRSKSSRREPTIA